jgi:hypothetical protein
MMAGRCLYDSKTCGPFRTLSAPWSSSYCAWDHHSTFHALQLYFHLWYIDPGQDYCLDVDFAGTQSGQQIIEGRTEFAYSVLIIRFRSVVIFVIQVVREDGYDKHGIGVMQECKVNLPPPSGFSLSTHDLDSSRDVA